MTRYTVQITVHIYADSEHQAYKFIKGMINDHNVRRIIRIVDAEVTNTLREPEGEE